MIDHIAAQARQTRRPRSRLGCLGSCLVNTLMLLAFGIVLVLGVDVIIAPWVFYLGGTGFHIIPGWSGEGTIHTQNGDFVVYVTLNEPQSSRYGAPYLKGAGWLCSPRGERFNNLHAYAYFKNKNIGRTDTDNQPVDLEFDDYYRDWINADYRPEFKISGSWNSGNFTGDDQGSLASAFLSDGTAYLGPKSKQPQTGVPVAVTLTPGGFSDFKRACNSLH
jgi:hypothetical protein